MTRKWQPSMNSEIRWFQEYAMREGWEPGDNGKVEYEGRLRGIEDVGRALLRKRFSLPVATPLRYAPSKGLLYVPSPQRKLAYFGEEGDVVPGPDGEHPNLAGLSPVVGSGLNAARTKKTIMIVTGSLVLVAAAASGWWALRG